jgi:hypothetical protein
MNSLTVNESVKKCHWALTSTPCVTLTCTHTHLVITPVQRIPRYNLLLKDLLSKTSQNHRDYPDLVEGLKEIQKVAVYVNEKMREYEHQ